MKQAFHFFVETPAGSFTWIGGRLIPEGRRFVWLTTPDGTKAMRVPRMCVQPSTMEETAKRMLSDARMRRLEKQNPEKQ